MSLSDDLAKLDQFTEMVMIKVYNYMANALEENDLQKLPEYTKANNKVSHRCYTVVIKFVQLLYHGCIRRVEIYNKMNA